MERRETKRVSCDWSRLTLSDVSQLGLFLRRTSLRRPSVWARAQAMTQVLFESLCSQEDNQPLCPLVRVFRTIPVRKLSDDDQRYLAQGATACGETALQLIGTYGVHPGWCDPSLSSTYRCIAVNGTFGDQYPMLSALMQAVRADSPVPCVPPGEAGDRIEDTVSQGLQMFYVSDARKSPYIPAQANFVDRYHIRSVIGFGGQFRDGEYFFVVLFSREVIPQSVLPLMRILSLNMHLGLERNEVVESGVHGSCSASGDGMERVPRRRACDAGSFEELLGLYERTVMQQDRQLQHELVRIIEQQREIEEHAARVQALNRQLLVASEEERRALSRDLHDIVATQLGGMIFQMQAVLDVPGEGREELLGWIGQYRHELLEVVQRTRELSFALHPSSLERAGVVGALERVLREAARRQQWLVESHCDESVERVLTYEESVCVYRVAQEAIHNCEKHAHATRVRLSLGVQGSELVLCVTDNGCGFENSVVGSVDRDSGLGHLGMSERAHLIRAVLKIESTCMLGTTVALYIQDGGRVHREGIAC